METELAIGGRITLRDGTRLSCCVWLPLARETALPTCLMITCYNGRQPHKRARQFNNANWAFVGVDCRGRGDSDGAFDSSQPVTPDDAIDICAWIAAQPWSNGEIATRGGSMLGQIQWSVLAAQPPGLIAAAPNAAAKPGFDSDMLHNIVLLFSMQWAAVVHGRADANAIYDDDGFWTDYLRRAYREHWSLKQIASGIGHDVQLQRCVERWTHHPGYDDFWESRDITEAQIATVSTPILSVTGYFDGNQFGTLNRYRQHMHLASKEAKAQHYLVIGPWDHAGTGIETQTAYGVTFPDNSYIPRTALHLEFFNWARGLGNLPAFLENRVGWYVMGANEWRWAARYEDIATDETTFFLGSDGRANAFHRAGDLTPSPPVQGTPFDSFVCDPFDLRNGLDELADYPDQLTDPAYVRLYGTDGLVYVSEPFTQCVEVAGIPRLVLWLQADAPDFDLWVVMHEILADGRIFNLTETQWRARWRHSLREERLMTPGKVEECVIDRFYFFARRIGAGSRLRIVVRALSSIMHQRNYNIATPVAAQTAADGRVATVRLYHDAAYPSRVELPVSNPGVFDAG